MSQESLAGQGGTAELPPMPAHWFVATLSGVESRPFATRAEAKAWIQSERESNEDWDGDSSVRIAFEE